MEMNKKRPLSREKKTSGGRNLTSPAHSLEFQAESVYTYITCKPYNDLASRTIKDQEKVRSAKAICSVLSQKPQMQA